MKILTPNPPKSKHLEEIKEEMKELGSPTIRMVDRDKYLVAIEGSHRLNAARDLKMPVKVKLVDPEGFTQNHDFDELPEKIRVGKLAKNVEKYPQSYITIPDNQLQFI
jgi:hypothetical protein